LNAKIQTLEHGSKFVGKQEALPSQLLKNGTTPIRVKLKTK
jgi:hypothetical protein